MRKILGLIIGALLLCSFTACDALNQIIKPSQGSETSVEETSSVKDESSLESSVGDSQEDVSSEDSQEAERHPHNLKRIASRQPKCNAYGNILHWYCETCDKYFSDSNGYTEITYEETLVEMAAHLPITLSGKEPTCANEGMHTYYMCSTCSGKFLDEACTQACDIEDLIIATLPHNMTHHEAVEPVEENNGVREHWSCSSCGNFYADEAGTERISEEQTVWYPVAALVDFVVEVPEGRDPIVLQLTDTQIIDAGQIRPGRDGVDSVFWATDQVEERCYDYVTEIINATNPDLIILTGDIIYGEFDDSGSALLSFIQFMESFEIPWAPIFGNHDNESKKGVDWQCQQLENAEYCLFEQKTLTGNGNYSVGIVQGNQLQRVFYMMDSNGCGHASEESKANGHTPHDFVGFKQDQIDWYTQEITIIKGQSPDTKISFAYHIQQSIFGEAYAKYGFIQGNQYQDINLDTLPDTAEGDFGYIGRQMKGPWDSDKAVYNGMKALGVDSIFVGHEHCNSASVVYEGIRFQYGQKSSEYERFNSIDSSGVITGNPYKTGTSLIGGTVIVLSEEDASIEDAYIYYCSSGDGKIANGQIDWDKYKPIEVNGLKKGTEIYSEGVVVMDAVEFDETTNAYRLTANSQGKILINPALLAGKSTVSFSMFVPTGSNIINNWGAFALRFKLSLDNGTITQLPGIYNDAANKYYQIYKENETNEAIKIVVGEWKTYTVDVSGFGDHCIEFAFLIAAGNTLYLKDVTVA